VNVTLNSELGSAALEEWMGEHRERTSESGVDAEENEEEQEDGEDAK
jgi:hypothetical protein